MRELRTAASKRTGGNAAGKALPKFSLGTTGNSIAGAIGGVILAQIIQRVTGTAVAPDAAAASGMDIGTIIKFIITSGIGGGLLAAVVGMIKNRSA